MLDGPAKSQRLIPQLVIDDGWTVDDLRTIDDCDDAEATLTAAIISIENQLDEAAETARETGQYSDPQWFRSAKSALRYRKAALQAVARARGKIARDVKQAAHVARDRVLLDIVKETEGEAFARALEVARRRFPTVYVGGA